jgi:hypothetical protein
MSEIVDVLVKRDGISKKEAEEQIAEIRERIYSGEIDAFDIDDVMMDELGLEPDYIEELLGL